MAFLLTVLGVVLIFEGVPWFLSPERARSFLFLLAALPVGRLRAVGFFFMALGLLLVYLGTGPR